MSHDSYTMWRETLILWHKQRKELMMPNRTVHVSPVLSYPNVLRLESDQLTRGYTLSLWQLPAAAGLGWECVPNSSSPAGIWFALGLHGFVCAVTAAVSPCVRMPPPPPCPQAVMTTRIIFPCLLQPVCSLLLSLDEEPLRPLTQIML